MHLRKIQKISSSKRKISFNKNTITLVKIVKLWKLIFTGYIIACPEIQQPLQTPVAWWVFTDYGYGFIFRNTVM
jgi:hypothetical protein